MARVSLQEFKQQQGASSGGFSPLDPNQNHLGFKTTPVLGEQPKPTIGQRFKKGFGAIGEAFGAAKERSFEAEQTRQTAKGRGEVIEKRFQTLQQQQQRGEISQEEFQRKTETAKGFQREITGLGTQALAGSARAGVGVLASPFAGIGGFLEPEIEKVGQFAGTQFQKLPEPVKQKVVGAAQQVSQFAEKNPALRDATATLFEAFGLAALPALKKAGTETLKSIGSQISKFPTKLPDLPNVTQKLKEIVGGVNTVRKEANLLKVDKKIDKSLGEFISSKQSISRQIDKFNKQGTDIKKHLSNPQIFQGLKSVGGKLDPEDAIGSIDDIIERSLNVKREILPLADKIGSPISKETLRERALAMAPELTPLDQKALIKRINAQIDELPDEMNFSFLDKFRAKARNSARDAKGFQKSDSEFSALENASRDIIFTKIDELPLGTKGTFGNLNKYIKELIGTKEFLGKTSGTIIKSGRLTQLLNKTTGAIIGSGFGGPLGAIAGAEISGIITNIVANKQLANSIKKKMLKNLLGDTPDAIKKSDELLKRATEFEFPQLPAPKAGAIQAEVKSPIPLKGIAPDEPRAKIIGTQDTSPKASISETTAGLLKDKDINFQITGNKSRELIQAESDVLEELAQSVKGERVFSEEGVSGLKSTFPDWVPDELRLKKLFDSTIDAILEGKDLTGRKKQLFEAMKKQVRDKLEKKGTQFSGATKDVGFKGDLPF